LADALAQTGEYSIFGLARAGEPGITRERRVNFALIIFAIATVVAVLYSIERYFYRQLYGEQVSLGQLVPTEIVFTYIWALLTPLVMWMGRHFPVWVTHHTPRDARTVVRNWIAQLVAMLSFVMLHVALFTGATLLLAGGTPPVARVFTGYLASWFTLDSIVYCTLLAVYHALVYYRVSQDRALRASQLEARLAQAQLQVLRMQLQPHFLFNTLHTISALMHRDVKRADSMIAALSDLLRMSLRSVGVQEVDHVAAIRRPALGDGGHRSRGARCARAHARAPAARRELAPSRLRRRRARRTRARARGPRRRHGALRSLG
jgi:hypothetical protein